MRTDGYKWYLAFVVLNPFVGWAADYSLRLALLLVGLLPLGTFVVSLKEKKRSSDTIQP